MNVVEWVREAPGWRLVAPAIVLEWVLFGAWIVHLGEIPI